VAQRELPVSYAPLARAALLYGLAAVVSAQPRREPLTNTALAVESPVYVRHTVVLPLQFDDEALMTLAERFLARFKGVPFATMYVGTEWQYTMSYPFKGPDHTSLEGWFNLVRRRFQEGLAPPTPLAEVNILSQQAILRIRASGKVRRLWLTGDDPLIFRVGSTEYEILEYFARPYVPPAKRPIYEVKCADCVSSIVVFVRCRSGVNPSHEAAIQRIFQAKTRQADVFVVVGPDHYFVRESDFPLLYAFEEEVRIPTPGELKARKSFVVFIPRKESKKR
jgi:hypothetical protein